MTLDPPLPPASRVRRHPTALVAGWALPGLLALAAPAGAQPEIDTRVPDDAPARLALTAAEEPGPPLVVTGTVAGADGNPVAGAGLFVYQTGADGVYGPRGNADPRLRGFLRTDADGRFELRTVRPGSYPGSRVPAHIHFHATPPAGGRVTKGEVVFADDSLLGEGARRSPRNVLCTAESEPGGELRCAVEIRLQPE